MHMNDLLIEVDVELLLGGGILKGWRLFPGVGSPLSLDSSLEVFNSDLAGSCCEVDDGGWDCESLDVGHCAASEPMGHVKNIFSQVNGKDLLWKMLG